MSSNASFYVGPYLEVEVEKKSDWWYGFRDEDDRFCDGRGEFGVNEDKLFLIPNQRLPGIERQMEFDRYSDTPVISITESQIDAEKTALRVFAEPVFKHCRDNAITVRLLWGVVPRWS